MNPTPQSNPYLRTKIMTASPEELRLMLYDGALKFCRLALPALEKKDFETSYHNLMRAQKIVLELSTSLNHDIEPDLCDKLSALYTYIYRLLIDANLERKLEPIEQAIGLLEYEKETWQMLMATLAKENATNTATSASPKLRAMPQFGAQQTAMSSLSVNG